LSLDLLLDVAQIVDRQQCPTAEVVALV
jgi:hypothetical protein